MTAPSPRDELLAAAARLAAGLGWPPPDEVDLKYPDHPPLSVRRQAERKPPPRKRADVQVLQSLRSKGPLAPKELIADTGLSKSTVHSSLKVLLERGDIEDIDGKYRVAS